MDGSNLSRAEAAEVEKRLVLEEVKTTGMVFNQICQDCFNMCAKNFRTQALDSNEKDCIYNCAHKLIESRNRIASRVNDISEEQNKQGK